MNVASVLCGAGLLLAASCREPEAAAGGKESSATPVPTVDSVIVTSSTDSTAPAAARQGATRMLKESTRITAIPPADTAAAPSFEDAWAALLPPPQQFSILADRDTVLRGTEGTLLRLPANSFVDAAGRAVAGTVQVTLEEFYSAESIVAAGLHTQSGDRLLETGGMIYWTARSGNGEVAVATNAGAAIGFPAAKARAGMQLFAGVERGGRLDWQAQPGGEARVSPAFQPALYPGGSAALAAHFQRYIDPTDIIRPGERRRYTVFIQVDETGRGSLRRISPQPAAGLTEAVTTALRAAARWQPAQRMGAATTDSCLHYLDFEWSLALPFDTIAPPAALASPVAPAPKAEPQRYEPSVQESMQRLQYYMMEKLTTGWVNCDRYFTDPAPRVEFVLHTNPRLEDVRLICNRYRMFLSGASDAQGRWRFPAIPAGERVTVVAIRKMGGELGVAFAEAEAGDPPPELRYQPMTMGDIRRRLQRIGR